MMGYAWSTDGVLKGDQLNACGSVSSATPSAADLGTIGMKGQHVAYGVVLARWVAISVANKQCGT